MDGYKAGSIFFTLTFSLRLYMYTRLYMYVTVIIHVSTHASFRHNVDLLYSSNVYKYLSLKHLFQSIPEGLWWAIVTMTTVNMIAVISLLLLLFSLKMIQIPETTICCAIYNRGETPIDFLLLNVGNKIGNSIIAAHMWGPLIMYLNCKRITTNGHLLGLASVQPLLYI